ncbi:MAG: vWA domain-containing protein [Pseudomonadota bacterium]
MQAGARQAAVRAGLAMLGAVLVLASARPARADLDVVFVLDTTGSMSGELREVKERVVQISQALRASRPQERVRLGVVAYRDQGDQYVTKQAPLTEDVEQSQRFLAALVADGGGDGPEDVLSGLHVALNGMNWDRSVGTERQIFLIGDAPPHLDYHQHPTPEQIVQLAHDRQVAIHAIGCRSLPSEGVAFFRRIAYQSEGSYQHIGRVSTQTSGVAEAMMRTLAREPEPTPRTAVTAREVDRRDTLNAPGVLVYHGGLDAAHSKATGAPCTVSLVLPEGTGLAGAPVFEASDDDLQLRLHLTQGVGGATEYLLDRCLPITTPIRVEFGGAS